MYGDSITEKQKQKLLKLSQTQYITIRIYMYKEKIIVVKYTGIIQMKVFLCVN